MILVIGATGHVGRYLVEALKAKGTAFRTLVRRKEAAEELERRGIAAAVGDLTDPKSLTAAFRGVSKVYLLSPPVPDLVALESNAIDAAKKAGVEHIVKHSGVGASPHAADAFSAANGLSEFNVTESGVPYTFLRPTFFMQNIAGSFGPSVARASTIAMYAVASRMTWVDTRDIADVAATVLTESGHEGRVYDLTGSDVASYADIAAMLSRKLARPVKAIDISEAEAYRAMIGAGLSPYTAHGIIGLQYNVARSLLATPTGTVERITGKAPRTLDAYLDENLAAFRA